VNGTASGPGIGPGTVADYHGSQRREHGRKVITGWYAGRLALMDPDYPGQQSRLLLVRPESVTLTGEAIPLCARCLCPSGGVFPAHGTGTWCWWCRDNCARHGERTATSTDHPPGAGREWDSAPFPAPGAAP
jgi:hypothetical protein